MAFSSERKRQRRTRADSEGRGFPTASMKRKTHDAPAHEACSSTMTRNRVGFVPPTRAATPNRPVRRAVRKGSPDARDVRRRLSIPDGGSRPSYILELARMSIPTSKLDAARKPWIAPSHIPETANQVGGNDPTPPTSLRAPRPRRGPSTRILHQVHISLASRLGLVLSALP